MAYYGAPGSYGGAPGGGYGGYAPQSSSSPPGMAPGMVPGMGAPPGMMNAQHPLPNRPGDYGRPPNMPNFDMNASVIRLGTGQQKDNMANGARGSNAEPLGQRRAGLGMNSAAGGGNIEAQRQQIRESMQALLPPKPDEVLKTIFVGNITEGCRGDAGIEQILRSAGALRKWTRAFDADNKPCTFGFAEFEDSESLETAAEVLKDVYVPVKKQVIKVDGEANGTDEIEKAKLQVVVDDASREYAEHWAAQRNDSEELIQNRHAAARAALQAVLERLDHPYPEQDHEGDLVMQDTTQDPITGEVVAIPAGEDELSMVPAEMRETVAAEIQAFRDRSNRRDLERLKKEEEMETRDRGRSGATIPTGPASGANGIPSGPKGIAGAPSGPKAIRGVQIPKDYQNGVNFVNGTHELNSWLGRDEEADTDASDEELEKRRQARKEAELEKAYLDHERRWLNRERTRGAALERERAKDENEARRTEKAREDMRKFNKEWDDDKEAARMKHEYYADRSAWAKKRLAIRGREIQHDASDRQDEERERRAAMQAENEARGAADDFLNQAGEDLAARGVTVNKAPAFKISLGAAAQKARQAAEAPKRKAGLDVENLLDTNANDRDERDEEKRQLVPIKFDTAAEAASLTPEERAEARRQLAYSIPQDKEGLFTWDLKWDALKSDVVEERLKPYVEKRSMEYLGVVEELVWDVVKGSLEGRQGAESLVAELEDLLGEETEGFVRKVWRMVVFYSESESRGLSGDSGE